MIAAFIRNQAFPRGIIICLAFMTVLSLQSFVQYQPVEGETLFRKNCARCHGADGTRGLFGAKNLKTSSLPDEAIALQIKNGKGFMPPFKKKLAADEIAKVMLYVKSLRKN
jgi:cytochrome c6